LAEVIWTVSAIRDLDEIASHIAIDSPPYASIFVARIVRATRNLGSFSRMGRVVPEFHDQFLRELIFQNYRIVYRVLDEGVAILAVWHGAMDLSSRSEAAPWNLT